MSFENSVLKNHFSNKYPYIFVHGLFGWGSEEGIDGKIPYWGATSGSVIEFLAQEGIEAYSASVGTVSSTWDRACELYAQLAGKTVDYGAAHSRAHNHKRFGRTYDKPLFEGWSAQKKVNLLGHSFGGQTVRLLAHLMAHGDEAEREYGQEDMSDLFLGGKGDWVFSVSALCTPMNGTTLRYKLDDIHMRGVLQWGIYTYIGLAGRSRLDGFVDFHMEQFALTKETPGNKSPEIKRMRAIRNIIRNSEDTCLFDLMPEGCNKLNGLITTEPGVYYFSHPFQTTLPESGGVQKPDKNTMMILKIFGSMMGKFRENSQTDFPVDAEWLANDGLVPVCSAKYPFFIPEDEHGFGERIEEPHRDFDCKGIEKGVWQVYPVSRGDHGSAIGLGRSKEETKEYYIGIVEQIEKLANAEYAGV